METLSRIQYAISSRAHVVMFAPIHREFGSSEHHFMMTDNFQNLSGSLLPPFWDHHSVKFLFPISDSAFVG